MPAGPWPRLPIDRVFAAKGFGTVVTGTLHGGALWVGDPLVASPGGPEARVARPQHLTIDRLDGLGASGRGT